jgi:hypothetical protein
MNIIERIRLRWKWVALQGKPIPWWEYDTEPLPILKQPKLYEMLTHGGRA